MQKLELQGEAPVPRVPLGGMYSGECGAHPNHMVAAAHCNSGYARGSCEHFPDSAPADAVRFHVASKTADSVNVQYIFERNCWPLKHGVLVYSRASRAFAEAQADPILERQAWAFLQSRA